MSTLLQEAIVWLIENTMPVFTAPWLDQLTGVQTYMAWIPYVVDTSFLATVVYDWLLPAELALDFPLLAFWFAGKIGILS